MKQLFNKLLLLGVLKDTPSQEIKTIKLLNLGCIIWFLLNIIFITSNAIRGVQYKGEYLTLVLSNIILIIILFLQYYNWQNTARIVIITMALMSFSLHCIYTVVSSFLEFYFLLIPIFVLIYFNNRWLSVISLLVAYSCFTFILVNYNNYPNTNIEHLANFGLFFAIYITFAYFKSLNLRSEKSLEHKHHEAVKANAKIEEQRKDLEELNKFQAHFWINLSHEMRTPLTLIQGNARRLLKRAHISSESRECYESIDANSRKLQVLLDNIMDLAKMKSHKLQLNCKTLDPSEVCHKIQDYFQRMVTIKSQTLTFVNECKENKVSINADPVYLERAIGNLLSNAIKYTQTAGNICMRLNNDDKKVSIHIEDNGCGIPTDDIPHIFDSFYRAKNAGNEAGSSGVGLAFSKEVIQLHEGSINVTSTEKVGSRFSIELPIVQELPQRSVYPVEHTEPIESIDILLVEDHYEMRQYIKSILPGTRIHEACNGLEALRILEKNHVDLIITDYMMPEMDGYAFVKSIRSVGNDTPVIVLTARVDQEGKLDFLRLGIDDYLTKPFNEQELIIRIKHIVKNNTERRLLLKEEPDTQREGEHIVNKELNMIKSYIEDQIKSPSLQVMDLANLLSISERTLNRKVKSWCGLTPNGLIRELKLRRAKQLLDNKQANSIKLLAHEVGFVNTSHLTQLFEERFGEKPNFGSS